MKPSGDWQRVFWPLQSSCENYTALTFLITAHVKWLLVLHVTSDGCALITYQQTLALFVCLVSIPDVVYVWWWHQIELKSEGLNDETWMKHSAWNAKWWVWRFTPDTARTRHEYANLDQTQCIKHKWWVWRFTPDTARTRLEYQNSDETQCMKHKWWVWRFTPDTARTRHEYRKHILGPVRLSWLSRFSVLGENVNNAKTKL